MLEKSLEFASFFGESLCSAAPKLKTSELSLLLDFCWGSYYPSLNMIRGITDTYFRILESSLVPGLLLM